MSQPQTFAAHITVCSECGREIQTMRYDVMRSSTTNQPCGHTAHAAVIPNPKLEKAS